MRASLLLTSVKHPDSYYKPGRKSWTKNYGPVSGFKAQQALKKAGLWPYKRPPLDMHDWNDEVFEWPMEPPYDAPQGSNEGGTTVLEFLPAVPEIDGLGEAVKLTPEDEPFDLLKELGEAPPKEKGGVTKTDNFGGYPVETPQ
ncbi:MAG: hypothetical protein EB060_00475 [Proteobacteria bacterium]|nr:hypothetical protein [Pseudomonadota bacterium]